MQIINDKYTQIQELFYGQGALYKYVISCAAENQGRVYLVQKILYSSSKKEALIKAKDYGYDIFPKDEGYSKHVFSIIKV